MNPRKLIVELIGTFFLVLTIGQCVIDTDPAKGMIAPLAIGAMLMVMVYAGGHISGGHFNPAVTLAAFIRGRCDAKDVIPYWVSQILGACLAAGVVIYVKGHGGTPMNPAPHLVRAALVEFLFTFALAYVVLNVATARSTSGNSFYGLAIGFTVLAGAFSVGSVSGGAFNPAVAIGATVMSLYDVSYVWILILADLAGGGVAGLAFKFLNPDDR